MVEFIQVLEIADASGKGTGKFRLTRRTDEPVTGPFGLCDHEHTTREEAEACPEARLHGALEDHVKAMTDEVIPAIDKELREQGRAAAELRWTPPTDAKVVIVCAACRAPNGFIAAGPRHFDEIMHGQIAEYLGAHGISWESSRLSAWEQGFIDQFGRFYTRREALDMVLKTGQPIDRERGGGNAKALYSEDLY